MLRPLTMLLFAGAACLPVAPALAAPESAPTPTTLPAKDPFAELTVITPREQLPPLRSVRIRDKHEQDDRSRSETISVRINTKPMHARVLYGGKLLGKTPLTLTANRGSTPFDVTIRMGGFMTLRTRIKRLASHSYFFKLTPAKFR